MIAKKSTVMAGAAIAALAVGAMELASEPTFVFLCPETSSFWHTATNNVMTVPVDFPEGATSASLQVSGVAYSRLYENIVTNSFTFELPPAESEDAENVYDLALAFNDSAGTVRTAKLGLVKGISPGADGVTRCLAPMNGRLWEKTRDRAVLPIPYGTTSLKINGVETPTGLDGAQGWYALHMPAKGHATLTLIANEITYAASLLGCGGYLLIMK